MRRFFLSVAVLLTLGIVFFTADLFHTTGPQLPAEVIMMTAIVPGCGNEILETGEECDGAELAGMTCQSKGFSAGVLSCTHSCFFNTTACVRASSPSGGGGGGGSKVPDSLNNSAQVALTGFAAPFSIVTVLKDSVKVATVTADAEARFQVVVKGLAAGKYNFSVYSTNKNGVRSATLSFPVVLTKGILGKVDALFIAPTLSADKGQIKQTDVITFTGQTVPLALIELTVDAAKASVTAGTDGVFTYAQQGTVLSEGTHKAAVYAKLATQRSEQSNSVTFSVGKNTIYTQASSSCITKGDLNNDCKVNLVDFSIAAFWYQRTLSPAFSIREKEHLSGDGQVNIIDFSIMAFHWTG